MNSQPNMIAGAFLNLIKKAGNNARGSINFNAMAQKRSTLKRTSIIHPDVAGSLFSILKPDSEQNPLGGFAKGAASALLGMMKQTKDRGERIGDLDDHTTTALIDILHQA